MKANQEVIIATETIDEGREALNQHLIKDIMDAGHGSKLTLASCFRTRWNMHESSQAFALLGNGAIDIAKRFYTQEYDEDGNHRDYNLWSFCNSNSIRTSGGSCLFDYGDNRVFTYVGNRAGHGNPHGFASRWSGQWIIHGKKGDLFRQGGRLTLFKKGFSVRDVYLKDLDEKLITDEIPQIKIFHQLIKKNKKMKKFEENSINTWILLEACNESARIKKRISLKEFKKKLLNS